MEDESFRKSLWESKEGRHECGPQDMTQEAGGPDMVQTSAEVGPEGKELPPRKTALPAQNDAGRAAGCPRQPHSVPGALAGGGSTCPHSTCSLTLSGTPPLCPVGITSFGHQGFETHSLEVTRNRSTNPSKGWWERPLL